jgi:hypothetical protein
MPLSKLNNKEFQLFDDSQYAGAMPPPPPVTTEGGRIIDLRRRQASFVTPDAEWHRQSARRKAGFPDEQVEPPTVGGMRTVIHASQISTPPHQTTHPEAMYWGMQDETFDRKHADKVIFAANKENISDISRVRVSPYFHTYEVPEHLLSAERFGDDDMLSNDTSALFLRSDTPELWETLPAKRKDAADRNQVIRFTNHYESPGSTSYILPKALINTGKIRYVGTEQGTP